jgi:hypothetical protein
VFLSPAWWAGVQLWFREHLEFAVVPDVDRGPKAGRLVNAGFWSKFEVDLQQVFNGHLGSELPNFRHDGRLFGQLRPQVHTCALCPASTPAKLCVRQFGTKWLCTPDPANRVPGGQYHTDSKHPIDVGWLDEAAP